MNLQSRRITLGILAVLGLLALFVFQKFNYAQSFDGLSPASEFVFNRTVRFILNDSLSILLIYAIFFERKYVVFAAWVQLIGLLFLLIPYFLLRIYWPEHNGPLLNFLHRIIINPTLMLLLIPALFHQRKMQITAKD
jgi:exosortase F-associated protein